jgi:hypothetical protein
MLKKMVLMSGTLITLGIFGVSLQSPVEPVRTVHAETKVVQAYPETVSIAMAQYDATEFEEQFLNDFLTRETKILAIPEDDGYGFLSGSATVEDAEGNIIAEYDAETDPNAATIGEILDAMSK